MYPYRCKLNCPRMKMDFGRRKLHRWRAGVVRNSGSKEPGVSGPYLTHVSYRFVLKVLWLRSVCDYLRRNSSPSISRPGLHDHHPTKFSDQTMAPLPANDWLLATGFFPLAFSLINHRIRGQHGQLITAGVHRNAF